MIQVTPDGEATVLTYPDQEHGYDPDATGFGPQVNAHAWAHGDPSTEPLPYRERHPWRIVVKIAAGIALAALVLIGAASMFARSTADDHNSWDDKGVAYKTPAPAPETPEPPLAPFRMPPPREAAHLTQDGDYLQRVLRAGFTIPNPQQDIEFAHQTCGNLARGFGVHQQAVDILLVHPDLRANGWSVPTMEQAMYIAASVYCPRLG